MAVQTYSNIIILFCGSRNFNLQDLRYTQWCCLIFKSSEVLFHAIWQTVTDILKDFSAQIFRVRQWKKAQLLDPEDEGPTILGNFCNYLPVNTVWCHQRLGSSVPLTRKEMAVGMHPHLLHWLNNCFYVHVFVRRFAFMEHTHPLPH